MTPIGSTWTSTWPRQCAFGVSAESEVDDAEHGRHDRRHGRDRQRARRADEREPLTASHQPRPTALARVALAITPAICGFSCSRRSEYSYQRCPNGT